MTDEAHEDIREAVHAVQRLPAPSALPALPAFPALPDFPALAAFHDASGGRRSAVGWIRAMLADLAGWVLRRPVDVPPGSRVVAHSADVRTAVWAVAATELVLDVAVDAMVPPAYRPLHLAWVAVSMVLVLGSCAMTLRTPHLIDGRVLRLRTGPLRELALPLGEVRHVRRAHGSVPGHGLRRVPGEDEAVACSVSRATTMVLELDRPLTVRVGRGAPVAARRVYFAADRPAEAARLIGLAAR